MSTKERLFRTKKGWLTPYAIACGYMETNERDGIHTTLWAESVGYHVRQHDFNKGERVFWESFPKLTDARACYKKAIKR